jgi:flavin reductase (DIM6/NTAB) family NADH-FMN oxidoreductase RutF
MFSSNQTITGERKDTVTNVEQTGNFVWNLATWDLREAVNITAEAVAYGVDEFERAKLTKAQATLMDVPMVQESPVNFECTYHSTIRLPGNPPIGTVDVVIGRVIAVHIKDEVLTDGILDVRKTQPIARCGYYDYAVIRETFEMIVPGSEHSLFGLEGNTAANRQRHLEIVKAKEESINGEAPQL